MWHNKVQICNLFWFRTGCVNGIGKHWPKLWYKIRIGIIFLIRVDSQKHIYFILALLYEVLKWTYSGPSPLNDTSASKQTWPLIGYEVMIILLKRFTKMCLEKNCPLIGGAIIRCNTKYAKQISPNNNAQATVQWSLRWNDTKREMKMKFSYNFWETFFPPFNIEMSLRWKNTSKVRTLVNVL